VDGEGGYHFIFDLRFLIYDLQSLYD
jgi:hypothetical protein